MPAASPDPPPPTLPSNLPFRPSSFVATIANLFLVARRLLTYRESCIEPGVTGGTTLPNVSSHRRPSLSDAAAGRTRRGVEWRSVSPPRTWLERRLLLRTQHKHKMAGSRRVEPNYRNKLKTEAEVALDTTANGVGDLPAAMWMYCRLRLACGRRPPASASVSYGGAAACVRNRIQSHDLQSENLPQPRHLDTSKSPRGHHIMDLRTWLPPSSCWPVPSPETHEVDPTTPHTQDLHTADRWSGLSLVQVRVLAY